MRKHPAFSTRASTMSRFVCTLSSFVWLSGTVVASAEPASWILMGTDRVESLTVQAGLEDSASPSACVKALQDKGWRAELVDGLVYAVDPQAFEGPWKRQLAEMNDLIFRKLRIEDSPGGFVDFRLSDLSPSTRAAMEGNLLHLASGPEAVRQVTEGTLVMRVGLNQRVTLSSEGRSVGVTLTSLEQAPTSGRPTSVLDPEADPRSLAKPPSFAAPGNAEDPAPVGTISFAPQLVMGPAWEGHLTSFGKWLDRQWTQIRRESRESLGPRLRGTAAAAGLRQGVGDSGSFSQLSSPLKDRLRQSLMVATDGSGRRLVSDVDSFLNGATAAFGFPIVVVAAEIGPGSWVFLEPDMWFKPML